VSSGPDDRVGQLAERYASQSRAYQELWGPVLEKLGERLLREVDCTGIARVLDIGTGVGVLLPHLARTFRGATVIGVDRSPGMLACVPNGPILAVMDASHLALAPRAFDLAVLAFVLFHLPEPIVGLVEAGRVLRAGGRIATATWGTELESAATQVWTEELDAHGAAPLDAASDLAQHELVDTPEKLAGLLASAGFVSIRSWSEQSTHTLGGEHLVRLRTSVGRSKHRFDSLDRASQSACLASARHRFAALRPEDFMARAQVVYSVARAP
jgi:SAM-dependent methyltransferase